jgi:hypothetical protein
LIFQTGWAFKEAIVDTIVFISTKKPSIADDKVEIFINNEEYVRNISDFLKNDLYKIDYRINPKYLPFLSKLLNFPTLGNLFEIKAGVKLYEKGKGIPPQTKEIVEEKPFTRIEKKIRGWSTLYRGEDIDRYSLKRRNELVKYGPWLAAPRTPDLFTSPKIIMRRTDDKLKSVIELQNAICVNSCHVVKLFSRENSGNEYYYFLALLNSRLLKRGFELQNPQMVGKIFSEIKVIYVTRLPVIPLDKENQNQKRISSAAEKRMTLSTKIPRTPQEKEALEREIAATDKQIDNLVYQLYGLTPEEIKIVEGT